jgi:hypothetical protein
VSLALVGNAVGVTVSALPATGKVAWALRLTAVKVAFIGNPIAVAVNGVRAACRGGEDKHGCEYE